MMSDRYRLLVESVTDYAIYLLTADGRVASWNPGARRFKGYDATEIIGQSFENFYTLEDRASGLPQRALRTAEQEGRFEAEGWRMRKDGTPFWAHVVIDPIFNPETRKVLGYAKITRDLTERREAELALKRSEEEFRLLVQGVTDYAIYMLDKEGQITNWNLGAERIKGYSREEVVGQHFSIFYTPEDLANDEPAKALETAIRTGSFEKEGWRLRKDGRPFWAHVVIDPIRDDRGEIIGFAKITRDLTDRRKVQEELERSQQALLQAQKIEAIGQLTGGIAHDFNNLLTAVVGSLELVSRQISDPKQANLIENAMSGAKRGVLLTQRMLAFARKQELALQAVPLDGMIASLKDLLQRSIGPLVQIETNFPASLPPAQADQNQLETALLNLVLNARDAMPEGGVVRMAGCSETVTSSNPHGLAPGDYLRISISDTGAGMDAETLAKAIEPFFTTKGVGKGTGLGLSMVHGMVEQSGGRLDIRSVAGQGTTVEIWLPAARHSDASEPQRIAPPVEPVEKPAPRLKVLAVDDDALVLMNTVVLLEDLGHEVVEASSAKEALARLSNGEQFDLLITDHAMPEISGAQLITAVSTNWPALPIILATGYAELPRDIPSSITRLSKPFWQFDLEKALAIVTANRILDAA
ncbi:PAS domain-containing sensor histidine kinase [Bosea sp. (in: a-proteobacteria)]|uniref:hybrid sensor histidine kinase/response regulator n=1 Tax=Bosea sp. (in: a-proteobacteria) TaxID=1871050 RepID=UPI001AD58595|nr:PAS domain-containing sensor histidine kinase [Bosea sp. (in: a-proteobacteria)]MBN9439386.1 PAS domain S-box protein [Bosea sp. (in: a-proteobacteria)]